jgi:4-amino-4-deoxy-L-arabinose transferase-like glycosyltransferase
VILIITACVALISAPNNWDSMTYHLTKILNWMDHHSLRNYPTHDLRQLYLFPWAEFAMLHLQVLSGGDYFSACIQNISMLGSVIGVSRVASKLGATGRGQLFASVCCVTIPMGILQGSSTQNDYVIAFWLVCFVNVSMDLMNKPISWGNATLGGASLGLVALTKTSGLLFAAPFVIWIFVLMYRRQGMRAIAVLSWMALCIAAVNASHMRRNWGTFGALLEPPDEAIYQNSAHSLAAIASNVIRNVAVHAAGLPRGAGAVVRVAQRFHQVIGWDINDRRTTFTNTLFPTLGPALHEDYAGNPLHVLLGGLAIVICLCSAPCGARARIYAVCVFTGFTLFCAFLKWQPWISRLQLPLFVETTPIIGVAFSLTALRRSSFAVGMVLLVAGLLPATRNARRPLLSRHSSILFRDRTSLYFEERSDLQGPYLAAAAELSRTPSVRVGVICGVDSWEYPLRMMVREAAPSVQFEYIGVQNSSVHALSGSSQIMKWPNTIVTIDRPDFDVQLGRRFPAFTFGPISIYRPQVK